MPPQSDAISIFSLVPLDIMTFDRLTAPDADIKDSRWTDAAGGTIVISPDVMGQNPIPDVPNIARYVWEFLPSATDDDDPIRYGPADAVVHNQGRRDSTFSLGLTIENNTETYLSNDRASITNPGHLMFVQFRDGTRIVAVVEMFDQTRVASNAVLRYRWSLRNVSQKSPTPVSA